jgi:hypothetical protein
MKLSVYTDTSVIGGCLDPELEKQSARPRQSPVAISPFGIPTSEFPLPAVSRNFPFPAGIMARFPPRFSMDYVGSALTLNTSTGKLNQSLKKHSS